MMADPVASPLTDIMPRVLVIEDDAAGAFLIGLQLDDIGCPHDIVSSAREALRLLNGNSYDIVLMNIGLPDISGYELVKLIRDEERKSRKPRPSIIAVTAYAFVGDRQKCLACGMDDYIAKPYNPQILRAALFRNHKSQKAAPQPAEACLTCE